MAEEGTGSGEDLTCPRPRHVLVLLSRAGEAGGSTVKTAGKPA